MGIIIRQTLKSTIVTYAGFALGTVNTLLLFPRFLEPDQFGLTRVLLSASFLLAQVAEFGGANVINRYFPFFTDDKKTLQRFVFWVMIKAMAAFAVVAFCVFMFKNPIVSLYEERSALLVDFFGYLFPLTLFVLVFNLLEAYARSMLRIVIPNLLREIYLRIFVLMIILLYHFNVIDFNAFIFLFAASYGTVMLVILFYVLWLDRHFLAAELSFAKHEMVKEIFVYGVFSILTAGVWRIVTQLDVLMLTSLDRSHANPLEAVAVYTIGMYIVSMIQVPQKYLHAISGPIIAQHIQKGEWPSVKDLYQRVSLNEFSVGLFLFIGIWVNLDNIYHFLPETYRVIANVVLILSVTKLLDMATSINGEIIAFSPQYKFNLWASSALVLSCIISNWLLIPPYGIEGAALGTLISIFVFNCVKTIFVYIKFGFLPFRSNILKSLFIGLALLFFTEVIPYMGNVYIDLALRSAIVAILFPALIYSLKISPDINDFTRKTLNRLKALLPW